MEDILNNKESETIVSNDHIKNNKRIIKDVIDVICNFNKFKKFMLSL